MKHNKKYEESLTFCPDISYYLTCNDKEYRVLTIVLACLMGTFGNISWKNWGGFPGISEKMFRTTTKTTTVIIKNENAFPLHGYY